MLARSRSRIEVMQSASERPPRTSVCITRRSQESQIGRGALERSGSGQAPVGGCERSPSSSARQPRRGESVRTCGRAVGFDIRIGEGRRISLRVSRRDIDAPQPPEESMLVGAFTIERRAASKPVVTLDHRPFFFPKVGPCSDFSTSTTSDRPFETLLMRRRSNASREPFRSTCPGTSGPARR